MYNWARIKLKGTRIENGTKMVKNWPKIEVLHLWIVTPSGRFWHLFDYFESHNSKVNPINRIILSLGTSRDYAQISKGKGGT